MSENDKSKKSNRKRRGRGEGGIFQRGDGIWTATLNLGIDGNGKRKRRTVYGGSKREVQEKLADLQRSSFQGTLTDPVKVTLGEYLNVWLETVVKPNRSGNTYRSYEMTIRLHVQPELGMVKLTALTPDQVRGLYATMTANDDSPRLRQLTHAILRRALQLAVKDGKIGRNVCDAVERPSVSKKEMRTWTPAQTRTFLATAKEHRLSALFIMAIATGARQGELFALSWENLDLDNAVMRVQFSLEEIDGRLRLKEPKSESSRRRIDLPAFAVSALKEHRKRMLAEGHISGPVFCDTDGGYLRKSNFVRKVFKPLIVKAGLPDIRFHDLRHGHATMLLLTGENPKVVQERLGHGQIGITLDTYSHVLPSVSKKTADKIDRLFRQTGTDK